MATVRSHQNGFATNQTSNTIAGATTTPLNSIPSVAAPFTIALDATNVNGKYEVVEITSKTATNVNHAATTYAHTTAEEVRMVVGATELDEFAAKTNAADSGWISVSDTWTYASADSPTFTITVPSGAASIYGVGDRVQLTQTTPKYFIITAVADTVLTVYGGTDYTLANAAISAVYYSHMKSPLGFPMDPLKWTVAIITDTTERNQASPVAGTWYNLGSLTGNIPIGSWLVSLRATMTTNKAGTADGNLTLSTANNTESDTGFSVGFTGTTTGAACSLSVQKHLLLAAKTAYYLNGMTKTAAVTDIRIYQTTSSYATPTIVRAICAYL